MFYITLQGIKLYMFVGIREHEYISKQPVVINLKIIGSVPLNPSRISECLDYTKVSDYLKTWETREHVNLVESLMFDLLSYCFKDPRVEEVEAEILKPNAIDFVEAVGFGTKITRELFDIKVKNLK